MCGVLAGHCDVIHGDVGSHDLQVTEVVEWAVQRLDLSAHADKLASQYSGGNRRKLSAAIALLGTPPLLLLVSCCDVNVVMCVCVCVMVVMCVWYVCDGGVCIV